MKQLHSAKAVFAVVGLAVLAFAAPASAETYLRVNIPFEFMVGGQVLPPGAYRITIDPNYSLSHIDSLSDGSIHRVILEPGPALPHGANPDTGIVQFKKYGETYSLSGIWRPGFTDGLAPVPSRHHNELAKRNGAGGIVNVDADHR